jgi:hypothetical protein
LFILTFSSDEMHAGATPDESPPDANYANFNLRPGAFLATPQPGEGGCQ